MSDYSSITFTSRIVPLLLEITTLFILILAGIIFLNNRKNLINKAFLFLSITAVVYSLFNYLGSLPISFDKELSTFDLSVLKSLRLTIFFAVWYAFAFFNFFYVLLKNKIDHRFYGFLLPIIILTSFFTLTNLVFESIKELHPDETIAKLEYGLGIILFGILTTFLVLGGLYFLFTKIKTTSGEEKKGIKLIALGTAITYPLMVLFNFFLPVVFENAKFVPYVSLITIPFLSFTAYAIARHHLFNIKVIATQLFIFLLWLVILIPTILSKNLVDWLVNGFTLVLTITAGIFLIRSVQKEVTQREKIEGLMGELGHANDRLWVANEKLQELDRQKTEFVSMATHQLRSPLTAIKGYTSMILENSFGPVEEKARGAIDIIFQSSQKLVGVIEDFLNISRIELGTMKYEKIEFDLRALAETIIKEQRPNIEKRGLQLLLEADPSKNYKLTGDSGKISQVVNNLIDNAVKYTREGWIKVMLDRVNGRVRLTVADSGVGIPAEVIPKLFKKFIRADGAGKINIQGTGLGLYVAKQIVEAHGGKIWAESEGTGKGSRFIVEL